MFIEMLEMDNIFSEDESALPQERKPPLGASTPPGIPITVEPKSLDSNRIEQLENEKDQLNASLFALTTRFAQIQFRLHQITEASPDDKDNLLQELEEFAHRGCVDHQAIVETCRKKDEENVEIPESVKAQHEVIINELKAQLNDLESFAFKQGAGSVPQSVQLEKQQVLIKQLKQRLNLRVDDEDFATTSVDDLKSRVDDAVAEIVNPAKMKEKLVDHLQTQIQDLERFVEFLQGEVEGEGYKSSGSVTTGIKPSDSTKKNRKEATVSIRRALALLQMFSFAHFACGARMGPEENMLVDTSLMMDQLKKAVLRVRTLAASRMRACDGESSSGSSVTYSNDSEEDDDQEETAISDDLTQAVRQNLCIALQDIIGHGLVHDATNRPGSILMAPVSCLLPRSLDPSYASEPMHPWELFLEYYDLKRGSELAKNPSRMLTRAFNLEDLVSTSDESRSHTTKASLLEAIHVIINEHNPLKRSYDVMFKAFVCLGLNAGRLSRWIRLIYRTTSLVSTHYTDSSYVARTGMDGVATVLSKLDPVVFRLPVDVAVRPFKNIRDAF